MRGRAVTGGRIRPDDKCCAKVVENAAARRGSSIFVDLWESGLRLSESLTLRWDDAPGAIVVDLTGRRPMLRIPAEAEKANTGSAAADHARVREVALKRPRVPSGGAGCSSCSRPMARSLNRNAASRGANRVGHRQIGWRRGR